MKVDGVVDETIITGPFTFTSPTVYMAYASAYAMDACSTLGLRREGVIPVEASDLSSVVFFEPNESRTGMEWVHAQASRRHIPFGEGKSVFTVTDTIYGGAGRPINFLHFQEPVPAEAYFRQAPDCLQWDLSNGDCATITYGRYRPRIVLPVALRSIDPSWASCSLIDWNKGIPDPPIALPLNTESQLSLPIITRISSIISHSPTAEPAANLKSPALKTTTLDVELSGTTVSPDTAKSLPAERYTDVAIPSLVSSSSNMIIIALGSDMATIIHFGNKKAPTLVAEGLRTVLAGPDAIFNGHQFHIDGEKILIDGVVDIPLPTPSRPSGELSYDSIRTKHMKFPDNGMASNDDDKTRNSGSQKSFASERFRVSLKIYVWVAIWTVIGYFGALAAL
jgi:hypothetical protein